MGEKVPEVPVPRRLMREPEPLTAGPGSRYQTYATSLLAPAGRKSRVCKLDVHVMGRRMFSGFRSVRDVESVQVAITSSRSLMIFLGWHRHTLPSSATLQGQVTGGRLKPTGQPDCK